MTRVLQVLRKMRMEETRVEFGANPLPQDWVGFTPLGVPHMSVSHAPLSPTSYEVQAEPLSEVSENRPGTTRVGTLMEEKKKKEKEDVFATGGTAETEETIGGSWFKSDTMRVASLALVVGMGVGAFLALGAARQLRSS